MKRTRLSLWYLFGYLAFGGIGLLFAPELALKLLGGAPDDPWLIARLLGMVMIGLAIIVLEVRQLPIEPMYPVTLHVRAVFLAIMIGLYVQTRATMVLVLLGIVGLGFVLTGTSYLGDRRRGRA